MIKENKFKTIPFTPYSESLGKTIVKIGVCQSQNTCRIVLNDGSMLWVQSVADENLLLKHGVVAKSIPAGESAESLGHGEHVDWFFPA